MGDGTTPKEYGEVHVSSRAEGPKYDCDSRDEKTQIFTDSLFFRTKLTVINTNNRQTNKIILHKRQRTFYDEKTDSAQSF